MRHVLFDLDGTLTDPAPGIVRCIEHALAEFGAEPPPADELRRFIGPPLQDTFAELLGTHEPAPVERAIALYRERFGDVGLFENAVFPGIPDVLDELRAAGCRLYVATSKPTVFAERIVAHFDLSRRFEAVYGSELSGERTDKADLLAHLLGEESLVAGKACMIGDRRHDIAGAKAVGVRSIGVLWGYGSAEELRRSEPDRVAGRVEELPGLVNDLALAGSRVGRDGAAPG